MHFFKALAIGTTILASASFVIADADVDVTFHKWETQFCDGDEAGDEDQIDDGHCESFDHEFQSFKIHTTSWNQGFGVHDDYEDPSCEVIIFHEEDCHGDGWSTGPVGLALDLCFAVPSELGTGHSAAVLCNKEGRETVQGLVEDGYYEANDY